MPQASEELRKRIYDRFGSLDMLYPIRYLESIGYKRTKDWQWLPKQGFTTHEEMPIEEVECVKFLIDEWDFGGVLVPEGESSGN